MFPQTISIDLGASFTKIGFRGFHTLVGNGQYSEEASLLTVDQTVLIPSLAIQTGRARKPWLFGSEAAGITLGPDMAAIHNWKAGLFNRSNNPDTAKSTIIANEFFRWLRERIESIPGFNMCDNTVRIMLPAFRDFGDLAGVVTQCMSMANWRPYELVVGTEPHANALGLLTDGRNVYTRGRTSEGVDYLSTYGYNNPYILAARNSVLRNDASAKLRIAILDIGAFTTDVAVLTFDVTDSNGDGLLAVSQESFPIGTRRFVDEPLWEYLGQKHGADFSRFSFQSQEEIKRTLLAGNSYAVTIGPHTRNLGDKADTLAIDRLISTFAGAILSKTSKLISDAGAAAVFLSGGGSQITRLVEALKGGGLRLAAVPAVATPSAARSSVPAFANWHACGEPIVRVATAVGGCSVLAPSALDHAPIIDLQPLPVRVQKTGTKLRACSCGGLNPECNRCDGSGYLTVPSFA
jgi:hypothetical protein